jgi:hypothetical protein
MPTGPDGSRDSTFSLYDGTQLRWTGSTLLVEGNPRPRTIEASFPDGTVAYRHLDTSSAILP